MIQIKRAYEAPDAADGYRVLVDRLWPRGVRKEALKLDEWAKEIAPSTELRQWFGHEPPKFEEFQERYRAELKANSEAQAVLDALLVQAKKTTVTLVYGSRDTVHNGAVVLAELLKKGLS